MFATELVVQRNLYLIKVANTPEINISSQLKHNVESKVYVSILPVRLAIY